MKGAPPGKRLRLSDIAFEETRPVEPRPPRFANLFSRDPDQAKEARLHWLVHTRDGLASVLFHHMVRAMPTGFATWFGAVSAPSAQRRYQKRIFAQRIARNFKALTCGRKHNATTQQQRLNRWWLNTGRTLSEFAIVNRLWRDGRIEVHGREHLESARALGGPLIFTSVHLSTWEAVFVAVHHGLAGPSIGPFQPEPNRFTNHIIHQLRKRRNQYLFPPGQKSAYRLRRLLEAGETSLTIFIDEVRERQVHIPFFGREMPSKGNGIAAIKLANACGGTIVPLYLTRLPGTRFKLTICPPVARSDGTYPIASTLSALNEVYEPVVLENLEEWYMLSEIRLPDGFEQGPYAQVLSQKNTRAGW
ncbi:KDO2-lipid IV(A) lauroyltransferase [Roseibium hamelinense]|uniref:KDO2-lipid IV(A) lauroyltransferase n=1 Tax=Roseibium hamelinense TaxID=150831 RepID=A0A562THP1_9HYPH|nr:lysophospholipid acyltransferase family protein [Roseibium hamelinense]MTI46109.1 hypothetical protein [Roseibium hamelinense]TWI92698.1 KDO2-lipid IV(A) lauroyltransferase [Roseibium hamelinense]